MFISILSSWLSLLPSNFHLSPSSFPKYLLLCCAYVLKYTLLDGGLSLPTALTSTALFLPFHSLFLKIPETTFPNHKTVSFLPLISLTPPNSFCSELFDLLAIPLLLNQFPFSLMNGDTPNSRFLFRLFLCGFEVPELSIWFFFSFFT